MKDCTSQSSAFASFDAVTTISQHLEAKTKLEQVSSAARSCEALTSNDEDEIIRLMDKTKLTLPLKHQQQHQLTNCIARSHDLIFSEAKNSLVNYDMSIQELQSALENVERRELLHRQEAQQQIEQNQQFFINSGSPKYTHTQRHLPDEYSKMNDSFNEITSQPQTTATISGDVANHKQKNEEDYIKVPVRDLISTFEQQVVAKKKTIASQTLTNLSHTKLKVLKVHEDNQREQSEKEECIRQLDAIDTDIPEPKTNSVENENYRFKRVIEDVEQQPQCHQQRNLEELYVPKDIPLESYAPPPIASYVTPSDGFPVYQNPSSYSAPIENKQFSGFPLNKPSSVPYYQPQSLPAFSRAQPQKQQSWPLSLHQQQQSSPTQVTPVNFNPSPLPYNKLVKFELPNPSPTPSFQASFQHSLSVPVVSNKLCLVSPISFSGGPMNISHDPSYQLAGSPLTQGSSHGSSYQTPVPSRPTSQLFFGGYDNEGLTCSKVDFSHCQNFNNSARGWGGGVKNGPRYPMPVGQKVTGTLRYSDF